MVHSVVKPKLLLTARETLIAFITKWSQTKENEEGEK